MLKYSIPSFAIIAVLSLSAQPVLGQERSPAATGVPSESLLNAPHEADAAAPKGVEEQAKGPDAEEKKEAEEGEDKAEDAEDEEEDEPVDPTVQPLQHLYDCVVDSWCCADPGFKDVKVSGYLEQSYTYNFNKPADRVNSLRVFDRKDKAYLLNMFQLYAVKDPTEESRWGFASRLSAGWDADVISSYNEDNDDKLDIEELYASYLFPLGKGLLVKAGKFVTLAGAEVIEQKDNFNISRSFLFGYALPYTHTGVRAQYKINDVYDVTFGVVRGWDSFRYDPNDSVTYESRLGVTCSDQLSMAAVFLFGPEQIDNDSSDRRLLDLVLTYKFNDKLTGVLNADFGQEENADYDSGTARWGGLAAYLKYECTEKLSFAWRGETFRDPNGARTGTQQTLVENTLTAQYKFRENLWGRLEYRNDISNEDSFTKGNGFAGSQNTVAASVLLTF